jgi:phosphotransferase system enzyme I (PtsI)
MIKKTSHRVLHGIPASPGLGNGVVFVHGNERAATPRYTIAADRIAQEIQRFDNAIEKAREQLRDTREMVVQKLDKTHAAIFEAQEVLLDDPLLADTCRREIREKRLNAEFILEEVVQHIRKVFDQIEVPHFSSQNLDVLDVASRIRENLMPEPRLRLDQVSMNSIIVAHDLRPSDTARLNHRHVLGIVTEVGGPTSHSAILAKALGIPAVVGLEGVLEHVRGGDPMIIDGFTGAVVVQPSRPDLERLHLRQERLRVDEESLHKLRDLPCETKDGYPVDLAANIEFPNEVESVLLCGAHGIGLFRSEFFYIDRGYIPSEEEQFQVYRNVIEQMAPAPVVCRTLDIGGDKFISGTGMTTTGDMNPFLGLRAIRLSLANPEVFYSQLRAILRASAFGNAKIMFPFITDLSEVRRAKELLQEIRSELDRKGIAYDHNLEVGIMIETPAAALTAEHLAKEVDFFSLGTNDLIQYTMAVDRVNESVAELYNPLHPAIIGLIQRTVEAAHKAGIWVGICGEMASDPALGVLLIGLGIDELSVSSVAVLQLKRVIRSITLDDVRSFRQAILSHLQTGQAGKILNRFRRKHVGARG